MKWTDFRLSALRDQPPLPSSSPRKRRLQSLQNSKRLYRTLHFICMWQNHATGSIRQINHRPPEWATVHIPTWLAPDLRTFEIRDQHKLWDFTTFAHSDFIEVCWYPGSYLGLKEREENLVGQCNVFCFFVFLLQTWSECRKASWRKYVSMWCPEPAFLKQESRSFLILNWDSALKRKKRFVVRGSARLCSGSALGWLGSEFGMGPGFTWL